MNVQDRVSRAKSGDIQAFGDLVEEFQASLRGFLALLGTPRDSIEDLAQETFVSAFKALNRFSEDKPFGPWIRGIARNHFLKFMRETYRKEAGREKMIADHSGRSIEEVSRDIERDKILTAEQAVEYGLLDVILESRKAVAAV